MHIDRLERYWLIAVGGTIGVFIAAVLASVLIFGVRLPQPTGRVDPENLAQTAFASPGVRQVGDNQYQATIVAYMWRFDVGQPQGQPAEIRIPRGAEVEFIVTSRDVTHGLIIQKHNVNVMLVPGQIADVRTTFDRPGEYYMICHEYCGPGHQAMYARIIVE